MFSSSITTANTFIQRVFHFIADGSGKIRSGLEKNEQICRNIVEQDAIHSVSQADSNLALHLLYKTMILTAQIEGREIIHQLSHWIDNDPNLVSRPLR